MSSRVCHPLFALVCVAILAGEVRAQKLPAEARDYWAYKPVQRPKVPAVHNTAWAANPIDAFILAKLEARGLSPAPPADRVALARRVWYDLTGLPPSPEESDAFVNDKDPQAYEKLLDRLLDSPHYGEKWGRHWLDLVRYAETHGYERDSPKPFAWRYRDYVIDAFNKDKSYDQFIREQLAGDELDHVTLESQIATGYYRLGVWDDEPADPLLLRYDVLDGIVSTTGQVYLGMSIGCARCHNHKKDPIPQRDYYRMLAFFRDVTDMNVANTRKLSPEGDVKVDRKAKPAPGLMEVMCVQEKGHAPTNILLRGNPHAEGDAVTAGLPEVLSDQPIKVAERPGKRRALADWLASKDNPLTARVMMNRLWQYHFGRGIVPTSNDFGKLGEPPTHPELLDWLASEFADGGWTLKRMHKLIMTSSAYRMSSHGDAKALQIDGGNQLLWRFNMRRLTAEEMRDSILTVSGKLNLKAGGPNIYPRIPKEVLAGQSMPGHGWPVSPPDESCRRSVYIHVKRSLQVPILAQHDQADTDSSCAVRYTTTVPTQALGMLNGDFTNEQAAAFAERLNREAPADLRAKVKRALRLTTGRAPVETEVAKDVAFIKETQRKRSELDALKRYCLLLLNANEFAYVD